MSGPHTRRATLRSATAAIPAVLAGCATAETGPQSPCPTPDEPVFRDVSVHNETDRQRTVTVTVTESGSRVFEEAFDVPADGEAGTDAAVFTNAGEYVVEAWLASGVSASLAVRPDGSAWRFYNGVAVDVDAGPDGSDLLDVRQPHGERPRPPC